MGPVVNARAPHGTQDGDTSERGSQGGMEQIADGIANIEAPKRDGEEEQHDGIALDNTLNNGDSGPASPARRRAGTSRSKSVNAEADTAVGDQNNACPHPGLIDHISRYETSENQHRLPQQQQQHDHYQQKDPHQYSGDLVPARLLAVLVDGSGKGWMAARRLWSVVEIGFNALAEAGLAVADVDLEQEVGYTRTIGRTSGRADTSVGPMGIYFMNQEEKQGYILNA